MFILFLPSPIYITYIYTYALFILKSISLTLSGSLLTKYYAKFNHFFTLYSHRSRSVPSKEDAEIAGQ